MRLHEHLLKSVFGKAALATAALSGFLLFADAPSAKANDWDDCNRRAAYADWRLHVSIEHFGWSGTAAISGEHTSGANVNGGSTNGVNTIATTMVTGTAITATGIAIEQSLKLSKNEKTGRP